MSRPGSENVAGCSSAHQRSGVSAGSSRSSRIAAAMVDSPGSMPPVMGCQTPARERWGERADRVVALVRAVSGNVLLFSSGHFLRMLAARWCQVEPIANARPFMLDTASVSALGYEHNLSQPVIRLWNDTHHLLASREHETNRNNLQVAEVTR